MPPLHGLVLALSSQGDFLIEVENKYAVEASGRRYKAEEPAGRVVRYNNDDIAQAPEQVSM